LEGSAYYTGWVFMLQNRALADCHIDGVPHECCDGCTIFVWTEVVVVGLPG